MQATEGTSALQQEVQAPEPIRPDFRAGIEPYNLYKGMLYAKVSRAAAEVGALTKTGRSNFGQTYSINDVLGALRGPMARNSVWYSMDIQEAVAGNGRWTVTYVMTLIDCETGYSETFLQMSEGLGNDDKALGKASAYALKYWLMRQFSIADKDTDDPDIAPTPHNVPQRKPSQQRRIPSQPDPEPVQARWLGETLTLERITRGKSDGAQRPFWLGTATFDNGGKHPEVVPQFRMYEEHTALIAELAGIDKPGEEPVEGLSLPIVLATNRRGEARIHEDDTRKANESPQGDTANDADDAQPAHWSQVRDSNRDFLYKVKQYSSHADDDELTKDTAKVVNAEALELVGAEDWTGYERAIDAIRAVSNAARDASKSKTTASDDSEADDSEAEGEQTPKQPPANTGGTPPTGTPLTVDALSILVAQVEAHTNTTLDDIAKVEQISDWSRLGTVEAATAAILEHIQRSPTSGLLVNTVTRRKTSSGKWEIKLDNPLLPLRHFAGRNKFKALFKLEEDADAWADAVKLQDMPEGKHKVPELLVYSWQDKGKYAIPDDGAIEQHIPF